MKAKKAPPYDKRQDKDTAKSFANTKKTVKPVAKDTNKTRRKNTLEPLKNKIEPKSFKELAKAKMKGY